MNINELFNEYIIECSGSCKKSTIARYTYVFKMYILPFFKNKEIYKISVLDINLWKIEINNKKLSYESKKKIYFNFSSLLNYAYRVYDIKNILHRCKCFKRTEPIKEYKIYTLKDFQKFSSVINNLEHKIFFDMLFYLGLRRGEALALTWEDINNQFISINKSKRKNIVSTPKTIYSFRVIKIPLLLFNELKKFYDLKSTDLKKTDFIFNLSETTISRYNKIYALKSNLPIIRIHDFRHSNISFLCSLGVSYAAVAKRVGHKNIKEIIETYLHTNNDEINNLNEKIEKEIIF